MVLFLMMFASAALFIHGLATDNVEAWTGWACVFALTVHLPNLVPGCKRKAKGASHKETRRN